MDDEKLKKQADPGEDAEGDTRSTWQRNKLYDKVPLTLRQLDIIIAMGLIGLAVVAVLIFLEATGGF